MKNWPVAGELTNRITFFENTTPITESGVIKAETESRIMTLSAKRIDGRPGVDDDGRLVDVAMVTYQMRFNAALFAAGGVLCIRDFDGDFDVKGPFQILGGRNRYMQCVAVKRG